MYLDVCARAQAHFACTKGITYSDMDNLEAELSRLRKLKGERLNDMLVDARRKIFHKLQVSIIVAAAMAVKEVRFRDLRLSRSCYLFLVCFSCALIFGKYISRYGTCGVMYCNVHYEKKKLTCASSQAGLILLYGASGYIQILSYSKSFGI